MQAIIDFLHKCRAWAEHQGMGNEEAALANAIRGLNHLTPTIDADLINRWNPETGEIAEPDENAGGALTLNPTGPLPGVAKDRLYNAVKVDTHSPAFANDMPEPMRGALAHRRVGDHDSEEVRGTDGQGVDPDKANPVEVAAEAAKTIAPPPPNLGTGVTSQEGEVRALPGAPPSGTDPGGYASGTQGTQPGPRSPSAPRYNSRSLAAADNVDLPVPAEEKTSSS